MTKLTDLIMGLTEVLVQSSESVGGALFLLIVAYALMLAGRLVLSIWDRFVAFWDRRRQMREVLVDVLIDAYFDKHNVSNITEPKQIKEVTRKVLGAGGNFRPYVASIGDDQTFKDYRAIRRRLDIGVMAKCDQYFEWSHLFHLYYEKLGSDAFFELDVERQISVLEYLVSIGNELSAARDEMQKTMNTSYRTRSIYMSVKPHLSDQNGE